MTVATDQGLAMKFSILLPSRNRLEYLKYAVESVVKQNYDNWEIVISDNDSEEDYNSYIQSLRDSRIKYFRTPSFCTVTENWNNAFEKSAGDYVIMLGDDDCLLKGYFKICLELLQKYDCPDLIYTSALNYVYPAVMPNAPQGYLMRYGYAPFLIEKNIPHILDRKEVAKLVKQILSFKVAVNFNMQHSLVSRSLANEMIKYGKFYQSSYPDYYATTALLIKAKRILAVPSPMVVIGVTPKSFGYYYFNNKEAVGIQFLRNTPEVEAYNRVSKYVIEGTNMNISWLLAMDTVKNNFSKEYSLSVNYTKFRFLQVLHQLRQYACKEGLDASRMLKFFKCLFWWEKIAYFIPFLIAFGIRLHPANTLGKKFANRMAYIFSHPAHGAPKQFPGQYKNISEVFETFPISLS